MQRYSVPLPTHQVRDAYAIGVLRRDHCDHFQITESFVRNQIRASRWTTWGDHMVLMQNVGPNRTQLMWLAVLDAGPTATLGSHTALELAGFAGWATEAGQVHLIIPRGARSAVDAGLTVHESRRIRFEDRVWLNGLPCTDAARSAIDAAAWQPYPRFACAVLAATVQQGICSAAMLDQALGRAGRIRHKRFMRMALTDIADGAQAMGELDVARLCRRYDLVPPRRQSVRRDSSGQLRYLDAEWRLRDGSIGVLEVDGRHHLSVEHWQDDMRRERGVVIGGRRVLRATNLELRLEPQVVAADLVALGVPLRSSQLSA